MKEVMLVNCKPEIISRNGAEITLRFPEGEEERVAFEEAVRKACLNRDEYAAEYAARCDIDPHKASATD